MKDANQPSVSEKIRQAFANGENAILVETQFGEVRISRRRTAYKAELIEVGSSYMAQTANDPVEALFSLGPWLRQRKAGMTTPVKK